MAHTNSTENYGLPQWIGTDKPTFLGDFNTAFGVIDGALKDNADASTAAVATANSASAVASSANTNATTALNTANEAQADATSAVTTATTANNKATQAQTDAASALHASAGNSIENLAPAYDPTLTYNVGDLVTYIDAQNSGKMYKCIVAVNTPMEFNINYWDDVTTSEVYAQISGGTSISDVVDMITPYAESTGVASRNYAVGDYFVLDSVLYRVTQAISSGSTIVPNTNCASTNMATELHPSLIATVTGNGVITYGNAFLSLMSQLDSVAVNDTDNFVILIDDSPEIGGRSGVARFSLSIYGTTLAEFENTTISAEASFNYRIAIRGLGYYLDGSTRVPYLRLVYYNGEGGSNVPLSAVDYTARAIASGIKMRLYKI